MACRCEQVRCRTDLHFSSPWLFQEEPYKAYVLIHLATYITNPVEHSLLGETLDMDDGCVKFIPLSEIDWSIKNYGALPWK